MKRGPTTAFYVQAALSFGISVTSVAIEIAYLPIGGWPRPFLAIGLVFVVTSASTLAQCVRDQQKAGKIISRVDQSRLEKLLTDHDLFKVPGQ